MQQFSAPPRPRSPLFGREADVQAVLEQLGQSARLITITGAGGMGKTRLATEVAHRVTWPVHYVPLADVRAQDLLATMSRQLAPAAAAERSSLTVLADALGDEPSLLVLDTFEHLSAAAVLVGELLDACPQLMVLVTSRSRLRLDGEQVYDLAPLDSAVETGAGVAMLRARAAAVGGRLGSDAVAVAICRQLDGLPLAIELAAARTTALPGPALLDQLTAGAPARLLDVLGRGAADAEPRHRSMRDTIAWSYALLDADARTVLRHCGIFTGSFALEAVEQVGRSTNVLDAIATLVDLHLVEPVDPLLGAPRFRLLDTIRDFARDLLLGDERARVEADLLEWALSFGADAGPGLLSVCEREWLERVDAELPTLRTVLTALMERGEIAGGLQLAGRLAPFWLHRGPMWEGRGWLTAFLQAATNHVEVSERDRAVALGWAGRLSLDEGDLSVLQEISAARDALSPVDDRAEWLQATDHFAYALTLTGDLDEADRLTAEAVDLSEKYAEDFWQAVFLQRWTLSAERHGDLGGAAEYAARTVAVGRRIGYDRVVARVEQVLARVKAIKGARTEAYAALLESLTAHRDCGDLRGVVVAMASLGSVAGDAAVSARWYLSGVEEGRRIGYWHGEAMCVFGLAASAGLSGNLSDAVRLDALLTDYFPVLRAGLPSHAFTDYGQLMAAARAGLNDQEVAALPRDEPSDWPAVRRFARAAGERIVAAVPTDITVEEAPTRRRRGPRANPELTEREQEILRLLCSGQTNRQIAVTLQLSPKTVMHHTGSVYRKLGVRGRAEAIAYAYRQAGRVLVAD